MCKATRDRADAHAQRIQHRRGRRIELANPKKASWRPSDCSWLRLKTPSTWLAHITANHEDHRRHDQRETTSDDSCFALSVRKRDISVVTGRVLKICLLKFK